MIQLNRKFGKMNFFVPKKFYTLKKLFKEEEKKMQMTFLFVSYSRGTSSQLPIQILYPLCTF